MDGKTKYFVFNKGLDFKRGYLENMVLGERSVRTKEGYFGRSVFISRILDSQEAETVWHRMTFKASPDTVVPIIVSVYASDKVEFINDDGTISIQDIIESKDLNVDEKKDLFSPFLFKTVKDSSDILLHEVCGRYLWIVAEIYKNEIQVPEIGDIIVYFPRKTWLDHLPEVYQTDMGYNSFLDRYLNIFQSLYDSIDEHIKNLTLHFDSASAEKEFLEWLAGWLDITDYYVWTEEKLRYLLAHAVEMYGLRGTVEGIKRFVCLYTGEDPFVVEQFQIEAYPASRTYGTLLRSLYGGNPYSFTVIVKESSIPSSKEYNTLTKIINDVKPAQMELNLVVVKPFIFLDGHSYMGVNSVLGQFRTLQLDGFSLLPFSVVEGEASGNR